MKSSSDSAAQIRTGRGSSAIKKSQIYDDASTFGVQQFDVDKKIDSESYDSIIDSGFLSGSCDPWKEDDIEEEKTSGLEEELSQLNLNPSVTNELLNHTFEPDEDGDTHLHLAIIQGVPEVIKHIIELVPDPTYLNRVNHLNQSPLHLAVLTHQAAIVRLLAGSGASLDIRDSDGNTPLHLACHMGDLKCVEQLTIPFSLTSDVKSMKFVPDLPQDLELRNYEGYSCLHLATFQANLKIIEHLAKYGANVNVQEARAGWTPLHFSVDAQNLLITKFLIESCKSDPKVQTYGFITPLHMVEKKLNSSEKRFYRILLNIHDVLIRFGGKKDDQYVIIDEDDSDYNEVSDEDSL